MDSLTYDMHQFVDDGGVVDALVGQRHLLSSSHPGKVGIAPEAVLLLRWPSASPV